MKNIFSILFVLGLVFGLMACGEDTKAKCKSDFDCEGLRVCNLDTGNCEPLECTAVQHCPENYECVGNKCQPISSEVTPPQEISVEADVVAAENG